MRQLEAFFDECDETVSDALEAHVGIRPAAESYSAILEGHADDLESALGSPPRRVPMDNTSPQVRADPVTFTVGK
ncbi:hypothetical protein, partial [Streptomyces sp. NPDC002328]|uniref:hypothetical protein n=1 Tax=Streptomyces sp. NPDC002328 TaxID=3364642 RepID=UPI0036795B02